MRLMSRTKNIQPFPFHFFMLVIAASSSLLDDVCIGTFRAHLFPRFFMQHFSKRGSGGHFATFYEKIIFSFLLGFIVGSGRK
mmetsp:Transcript_28087/g.41755  ORF Transcript_28087/g.41755 Transcript_28087/m.41755 type:complete len:82 (-) Transcript_28087:621-866(-)